MSNAKEFIFNISASGKFPGEEGFIRLLDFIEGLRLTMDPAIVLEYDKMALEDYKRWREFWFKLADLVDGK